MPASSRHARRSVARTFASMAVGAALLLVPVIAEAQTQPGKWTIELYGGGSSSSAPSNDGPIPSFAPGTPFTAESGQPSRAVSSWYFGDGAALLNSVLTQFSSISGSTLTRITPLDDALRSGGASRGSGGVFGLRIGRSLSPKLAVELNVERSLTGLELSDGMKDALKRSSDSFKGAFEDLLKTAPVSNLTVSSNLDMPTASNKQTRVAGSVKWTAVSSGRVEAYLTGGGGVLMNSGSGPKAILNGIYTFRLFATFPMNETDRVVVRISQPKNSAMGLIGGGVTYDLSSRTGLRADVRLLLSSAKEVTTVSASPNIPTQSPTDVLPSVTNPAIQFSTKAGVRSSLSGPDTKLTVATSSGRNQQVSFTIGIFRRF